MWVDNSPVAATDLDPGESGLTFRFGVNSVSVTPQPNPALFEPLWRIEDASSRAGGIILTGPVRPLRDHPRFRPRSKKRSKL
jgi:hypothetical protein